MRVGAAPRPLLSERAVAQLCFPRHVQGSNPRASTFPSRGRKSTARWTSIRRGSSTPWVTSREGTTLKRIALLGRQRSSRPDHPAFDASLDLEQDCDAEWCDDLLSADCSVTGLESHPHLQLGGDGSALRGPGIRLGQHTRAGPDPGERATAHPKSHAARPKVVGLPDARP